VPGVKMAVIGLLKTEGNSILAHAEDEGYLTDHPEPGRA